MENNYLKECFKNWTIDNLKNSIWMMKNGMSAVGGYPLEYYENELFSRTGSKKGYHEV